MSKKPAFNSRIADNKKAAYNYFFEERFEAGLVLEGWEVKSVREGKVQLTDGYVVIRNGELFILGLQIHALHTASTHVNPDHLRTRKLLMHKREIHKIRIATERQGMTLVALELYFNEKGRAKLKLGLAQGKKLHDKRESEKKRDWNREKARIMQRMRREQPERSEQAEA